MKATLTRLRRSRTRLKTVALVAAVALAALGTGVGTGVAQATPSVALIEGSGSSWAANALNQWIADVQQQGLQVVYTADGSAQGRQDFAYKTVDFADSDIGYQGTDPLTGAVDTSLGRSYAYIPVVAGGTSFPYHLVVAGQLVRNLRLSGETLAKIFTNQITNWDDPAITKDNNGHAFPSLPITPVVHSEGSGDTAQLSAYLATEFPSLWSAFSGSSSFTEYWPRSGPQVAQNGSDGVINFITSAAANGSIGYDEYSYALGVNYPVAKIENSAGYYTLPTQYNVAVALTKAQINMDKSSPDYLLQNLKNVYTYNDPRVYPLSSYSYGIIPTSATDSRETTAKRQTMADFFDYSVCQGQREIGPIGYSSLPVNLVTAAFAQIGLLHTADSGVDIEENTVADCHNPTFIAGQPTKNYLAEIAPEPPTCDETGHGPCTTGNDTTGPAAPGETDDTTASTATTTPATTASTPASGSSTTTAGGAGKTGATATSGSGATGSTGSGATGATTSGSGATGSSATDPTATGAGAPTSVGASTAADAEPAYAVAQALSAGQGSGLNGGLAGFAVVLVLALVLGPPYLVRALRRRRAGGS